jgi:hypothetical protein
VDELNICIQTPADLVAQPVDLLLEKQEKRISGVPGANFPPLFDRVKKEKKQEDEKGADR